MRSSDNHKHRRILVIDDNPAIHDDFRKILLRDTPHEELDRAEAAVFGGTSSSPSLIQYEIDSAFQGQEGLELLERARVDRRPYDMAFVDMRMPPGWDGVETIRHLWQVDPELHVVICTANSDFSWTDLIVEFGECHNLLILKKPFDNLEVLQIVAALVEKRRLSREVQERLTNSEELVVEQTREIHRAQEESERLLSSISSLLIGIDQHGLVRRWNIAAEQVLGIAADDANGRPFKSLQIDWQDSTDLFTLIDNGLSEEQQRLEVSFNGPDGDGRILECFVYPIRHDHENNGLLLLGADLTEHHRLQQQLRQAQKLESVGQLAAGVAHEINTPMQYIGDNVQYLRASWTRLSSLLECLAALDDRDATASESLAAIRDSLQPVNLKKLIKTAPEALEDAEQGVHHVSRIVRAMKEFSHPGSEDRSPVDLNQSLETTMVVAKNEWKYVADIETDFDATLPLVSGFRGELNQVFLNLLINAAHAVSSATDGGNTGKGRIRISTRHAADTCTVMIEDSGCGIPVDAQQKVFDPFFTTKNVGQGTGQGLAIAHQVIVQKHGGKLWFETEPNVGTTFFAQLPIEDPQTPESLEADPAVFANAASPAACI